MMDPSDFLNVLFHYGGEFVRIGPNLNYVGGDDALSEIERDKLSLPELKGFLKDHVELNDSMHFYFLVPGKELVNGFLYLSDDSGCQKMADFVSPGGFADVYVEYHGQEEEKDSSSGSDFEDEVWELSEDDEPDVVLTAAEPAGSDTDVLVTDGRGVVTEVLSSPIKKKHVAAAVTKKKTVTRPAVTDVDVEAPVSQVFDATQVSEAEMAAHPSNPSAAQQLLLTNGTNDAYLGSDSESDVEYTPHSEDSGEDSEVIELRRHARKFKKRMRDSKSWIGKDPVPLAYICRFKKSECDRVRAYCGWPGCPWLIYAAKRSRTARMQVITYNDQHKCAQNRYNKLVTAKVIGQRYEHFILANPMWKIESMKATVLKYMFADVSTSKCKHAKKIVMDKLMCGMQNEYTRVYDYQLKLLRSNPGSTVAVCMDPTNMEQSVFQSFYVCFNALKLGFKAGCRKVIGLDGCFFKGAVKGELLCAIARDANNQMYPLARAVVEQETNVTWKWFIGLLIKDLDINNNGDGWVFISDQQKGLINAMKDYLPAAEHRMCARHIYANWRKKHRDHEWQKKFWAVAKASNQQDFNYYKAKLAQETPDGAKDIMRTDHVHWARAFFPVGANCESVDNNLYESFNHAIVDARFYPIISMQEKIRKKVMVRIQEQREKGEKMTGLICPGIFKKLKKSIARTQWLEVLWNGETSAGRGSRAKRGKRRAASSVPSYAYFTCSVNY